MGKLMKLGSKNNMKFLKHVIKRAYETNSEKKMIRLKCEIILTGGLPHLPFRFCILLNGDVYNKNCFTRNLNTSTLLQ